MQPFVHLFIVFCLYTVLQNRSKSSDFLVFQNFVGILLRPAAFLFLIFLSNLLVLVFSWLLIIFMIGLFVTLREFLRRYLKCSFHICICFSWLAAFSSALEVLFLLLTLFTVCHAIHDCLSSNEFLILLI